MRIIGRDPAFWVGLVAVIVEFATAWGLDLSEEQQAGINAVTTAVMGLIVALMVARDQVVPVVAGLLTAVLQLGVSFGWELSEERIATAGALLTALLVAYLRTQVTAPIAPDGTKVPRQTPTAA